MIQMKPCAGVWGRTLTPLETFDRAAIHFVDGRISAINTQADTCPDGLIDASDAIIIPGLIDIQVNGALGFSFQSHDEAHFDEAIGYHLKQGTTTLLPTLVTAHEDVLMNSLRTLGAYVERQRSGCSVPGIHLEGPFLSPAKRGAHEEQALRQPDLALMQRFVEAAHDHITLVTLAPELPGSMELAHMLHERGVVVSAGHTMASYDDMRAAVDAGVSLITHAGNASDWPHRALNQFGFMGSEPGPVGSLLALPQLRGCIIMDGFHFHPALLRPIVQLKGIESMVLVSDASTVAGCPPGDYEGGGLAARVDARGFATSLRGGNVLAGSTITLLEAVQRAVSLAGMSLQEAVTMATRTPASIMSLSSRKGSLQAGSDADLLILNADLSLRAVIAGGQIIE